ncbi:MAG: EamA family transporter RarD, partial [Desulfocapsaceae bacterium]|nr:EamA family transporter RarD [Desulfocapsaceae bacterium]
HKKTAVLPVEALFLETLILFLPAAAVLLWFEYLGTGALFHSGLSQSLLMIGAGVVTTVPLLLFAFAAHHIPMSLLGILQYTAPTITFLLGLFLYHEAFPSSRMIGFLLVWSGLAIYLVEATIHRSRQKKRLLRGQ